MWFIGFFIYCNSCNIIIAIADLVTSGGAIFGCKGPCEFLGGGLIYLFFKNLQPYPIPGDKDPIWRLQIFHHKPGIFLGSQASWILNMTWSRAHFWPCLDLSWLPKWDFFPPNKKFGQHLFSTLKPHFFSPEGSFFPLMRFSFTLKLCGFVHVMSDSSVFVILLQRVAKELWLKSKVFTRSGATSCSAWGP